MAEQIDQAEPVDLARRFGGLDRLYGDGTRLALADHAHVMVVGVGGVGSWAVEALARSGVGELTLVDMDHVAESNVNRQLQATSQTLGIEKTRALAQRIAQINPTCKVNCVDDFLTPDNAQALLAEFAACGKQTKYVLDCCDQFKAKLAMVLVCKRLKLTLLIAGSAGGKSQPWLIQPADLRDTTNDPMLAKLRYQLRKEHNFGSKGAKNTKLGVQTFFSPEQIRKSEICQTDAGLNCAGYGSVVGVTATMGMQMAAWAVNDLVKRLPSLQ